MKGYLVLKSASYRIDEIHDYSKRTWGTAQAKKYITGLFNFFEDVANEKVVWKRIPASYEVDGFYGRYENHYVYWKVLDSGQVGITAILHDRMDQINRLQEDFS